MKDFDPTSGESVSAAVVAHWSKIEEPRDALEPQTCLDRSFVQMEIREARLHSKRILAVYEKDNRRQGFFDHSVWRPKYANTEWENLLELDATEYERDAQGRQNQ